MFAEFLENIGIISKAISATWFIALPIAFFIVFKSLWLRHVIIKFYSGGDSMVLELRPPRDTEKSPQLMESFFSLLAGTDKGPNVLERYLDGFGNPGFSFEIVGDSGSVHFYVHADRKYREMIESGLYAQYPGIEIVEVQDYTERVPKIVPNNAWKIWGSDYELVKPDPYPIRTYRKFEEDITGKMIDPLHTLIENFASLPPGQQLWLQMIISPVGPGWNATVGRAEVDKLKGIAGPPPSRSARIWKDMMDIFGGIFTGWSTSVEFTPFDGGSKEQDPIEFRLTPVEKDVLKGLEENLANLFFDVKMRGVLIGKNEGFSKINVNALQGSVIKVFSDNNHNGFKLDNASKTGADYAFKDSIVDRRSRLILQRYRDRDGSGKTFHLSTEELATLFHMPDMSVTTPGVEFVDSRKGNAPANLPFM